MINFMKSVNREQCTKGESTGKRNKEEKLVSRRDETNS